MDYTNSPSIFLRLYYLFSLGNMSCEGKKGLHLLLQGVYSFGDSRDSTFCIGEQEFYEKFFILVKKKVILQKRKIVEDVLSYLRIIHIEKIEGFTSPEF